MSGFWRTWMLVWCWGVVAFGAAFAAAALPAGETPALKFYDLIFWPLDGAQSFDAPMLRLTVAILGAVMMGWALTILAAMQAAERGSGAAVWRAVTGALLTWYAVDSAASLLNGSPMNVLSNTVFAGLFLAPVLGSGVLRRG